MAESKQNYDNQELVSSLQQLYEVQYVDTKIIQNKEELEELKKQLQESEQAFLKQQTKHSELEQKMEKIKASQRLADASMSDRESFIKKLEKQTTQVKSGEAYDALLHEMEHAKNKISELETQLLEGMEEQDLLSQALESSKVLEHELKDSLSIRSNDFAITQAEMEKILNELRIQRQDQIKQIDAQLVRKYEGITKKHHPALVMVSNSQCTGCHMLISIDLRASKTICTCDNCGRILIGEWMLDKETVE